MTNDSAGEKSSAPEIGIFLVAHTNVGKTSLIRTLLGKDVGETNDEPHVTQASTEAKYSQSQFSAPSPRLGGMRKLSICRTSGIGLLRKYEPGANTQLTMVCTALASIELVKVVFQPAV